MIVVWMLYAMAIGGCAVVAALALEAMLGSTGRPRRWVWVAALAVALLVPVAVAVRPVARAEAAIVPAARVVTAAIPLPAAPAATWSADRLAFAAWGAASLLLAVAIAVNAWRLRRARREGRVVELDGEAVTLTRDTGPGALWLGRPRILAPAWVTTIAAERRALLLRHEREHVRAGDPALLAASLAAVVAMPWNAALWIMAARLRTALELDCDARVLAAGADPHAYGELLLTVAAARRAPVLGAYLAFASSRSPLERRIRAMTMSTHSLGGWRRPLLPLVVLVATVVACETRRPEPLAPVTSYTISDGRTQATALPANSDSARRAIAGEVRRATGASAAAGDWDVTDPLVMVYDAQGRLVRSFRLQARGPQGRPVLDTEISPDQIATVEVIKNGTLLPDEARGGLVRITLKMAASGEASGSGATAAAGGAAGAAGGTMRPRSSVPPEDSLIPGAAEVRLRGPLPGSIGGTAGGATSRAGADSTLTSKVGSGLGSTSSEAGAPTVVVLDAEGRELLRLQRADKDVLRDLPVDEGMIARAEVWKRGALGGPNGTIFVHLKPGAALKTR